MKPVVHGVANIPTSKKKKNKVKPHHPQIFSRQHTCARHLARRQRMRCFTVRPTRVTSEHQPRNAWRFCSVRFLLQKPPVPITSAAGKIVANFPTYHSCTATSRRPHRNTG